MPGSTNNATVVITGCGLVCALGLDAPNACAAARAGIIRAASMDDYPVRSPADGSVGGVVCHPAPIITDGFEGEARLVRLVQGALEDLSRQCPATPWKGSCTAFYLSVPSLHRLHGGVELVADPAIRKAMLQAGTPSSEAAVRFRRAADLLVNAARSAAWAGPTDLRWHTESGQPGVAEAIRQATDDIKNHRCELAIVGGVDSLLDEETLSWLELTGRLKTPSSACGIQPGEACGFLLLESSASAARRGARTLARVHTVRLAEEGRPLLSSESSTGLGLLEAINGATSADFIRQGDPIRLIHDLNGELYRAKEWGLAVLRLASRARLFLRQHVWSPAVAFGETGAAVGALQVCLAIHDWLRSCSPAEIAALVSGADGALRACICISQR